MGKIESHYSGTTTPDQMTITPDHMTIPLDHMTIPLDHMIITHALVGTYIHLSHSVLHVTPEEGDYLSDDVIAIGLLPP